MWPFKRKTQAPAPEWPEVELKQVTMVSKDGSHRATDNVPTQYVNAYAWDAAKRWGTVTVASNSTLARVQVATQWLDELQAEYEKANVQ